MWKPQADVLCPKPHMKMTLQQQLGAPLGCVPVASVGSVVGL